MNHKQTLVKVMLIVICLLMQLNMGQELEQKLLPEIKKRKRSQECRSCLESFQNSFFCGNAASDQTISELGTCCRLPTESDDLKSDLDIGCLETPQLGRKCSHPFQGPDLSQIAT